MDTDIDIVFKEAIVPVRFWRCCGLRDVIVVVAAAVFVVVGAIDVSVVFSAGDVVGKVGLEWDTMTGNSLIKDLKLVFCCFKLGIDSFNFTHRKSYFY